MIYSFSNRRYNAAFLVYMKYLYDLRIRGILFFPRTRQWNPEYFRLPWGVTRFMRCWLNFGIGRFAGTANAIGDARLGTLGGFASYGREKATLKKCPSGALIWGLGTSWRVLRLPLQPSNLTPVQRKSSGNHGTPTGHRTGGTSLWGDVNSKMQQEEVIYADRN